MAGSNPEPEFPLNDSLNEKRLESWKEIAAHLNRDVSTVRRWEKREGLPIHRHVHDKLGTVYAYPSELDGWLESRGPETLRKPIDRRPWNKWIVASGVVAVVALFGSLILVFKPSPEPPITAPKSKPSIAVFHFDNLSKDPSLDWLRLGLADMLITDLSQSPDLEVLSTRSLYTILEDMNRLEQPITSLDVIQEVAQRAKCQTAVLGSFMKSGDQYRINAQVQDASSGRILASEKVEGVGESSLFTIVDDLTRRIRSILEIPTAAAGETGFDVGIEQVSTSSLEAYRYHIEGRKLHLDGKIREAQALYEKAVEIDPHYAMALKGLVTTHFLSGDLAKRDEYRRLTFENRDRLTLRERLYIEAGYYGRRDETAGSAIQALENLLELDPRHFAGRNNLALRYMFLERCEEAIEHLEWLRKHEYDFGFVPYGLSFCYGQRGQFDLADQVIREYLKRDPERPGYHLHLGTHLLRRGHVAGALDAYRKAITLDPLERNPHLGLWLVYILLEDWEKAEKKAKWLAGQEGERYKQVGSTSLATTWLYRGRSRDGLRVLDQSARELELDEQRGYSHNFSASILLQQGKAARALELAQKARIEGAGNLPERDGLFVSSLALAKLGCWEDAEKAAESFRAKAESLPTQKEKRRYRHLMGELALNRLELEKALAELEHSRSMLTARGFNHFERIPPHVPIWYSLAQAHLMAGNVEGATAWFQEITDSTTEHIYWPIPYVRSFYFLAKIHEKQGETEKARAYYQRFYHYWKDGDMDRERVEETASKLRSMASR